MKSASLSILSFILDFVQILADLSVCAFLSLLTWSPAPSEQSPAAGNHSGRGFRRAAKKHSLKNTQYCFMRELRNLSRKRQHWLLELLKQTKNPEFARAASEVEAEKNFSSFF